MEDAARAADADDPRRGTIRRKPVEIIFYYTHSFVVGPRENRRKRRSLLLELNIEPNIPFFFFVARLRRRRRGRLPRRGADGASASTTWIGLDAVPAAFCFSATDLTLVSTTLNITPWIPPTTASA